MACNRVMSTIEARLRRELHKCAVELRQFAYTLPNGVGEYDLLRLSDRMSAAAREIVLGGEAHPARA
jgi:hypothetical protein